MAFLASPHKVPHSSDSSLAASLHSMKVYDGRKLIESVDKESGILDIGTQ